MSNNSQKAINGIKWTSIEQVFSLVLRFIIGIVVARLVAPADYGLIAMLTIFMALGEVIVNCGLGTALIRHKENTNADYSTAFFVNVGAAFLIYFLLYIFSPFIADFYKIPKLQEVCRIYAISLLISSFSIVQIAKLTHELRLKLLAMVKLVGIIISGVIGVYLAYIGLGVWALVWYSLASSFFQTLFLWIFAGWKPVFKFSKGSYNYLISFGSKMIFTHFIDVIYDNIYSLVIGKFYSPASVGYYNRSLGISQLPQNLFSHITNRVFLPLLTPLQDDNDKLLKVYEKMYKMTVYLAYPIITMIIVLARPIVLILLGEKWLPSVPYLQILSFGVLFVILTLINLNLFFVKGRSDIILKLDIIKKIVGFIIVGITLPLGLYWICIGTILYAIIAFVINCSQTRKLLGYGFSAQAKMALPSLGYSFFMGLITYMACLITETAIIQILLGILTGAVSYYIISMIFKDETFGEIKSIVCSYYGK